MEDIRKGTCPLCNHNEIVEAPIQTQTGVAGLIKAPGFMIYACRRCGYFQPFFKAAADVMIEDKFGTRLIKGPEPEGPYR
jgi:predicted nucleic-acid-binding Zn-ribbon protein